MRIELRWIEYNFLGWSMEYGVWRVTVYVHTYMLLSDSSMTVSENDRLWTGKKLEKEYIIYILVIVTVLKGHKMRERERKKD